MMKATMLLLVAMLIPAKCTCNLECAVDNAINQKIQAAVDAKVSEVLRTAQMICTNVSARGADVSCPSGYKPTSCACGMGCGSWDIRSDTVCHCQCASIDWTSARCCRVGLQ
ncbi:resistin [Pogona vitticeps]|nr:resistin [Pogona vitticeps]XP_020651955.1 resistin [Pogona vitticeps]